MVSITFAGVETFQYNNNRTEGYDINDLGMVSGYTNDPGVESRGLTYFNSVITILPGEVYQGRGYQPFAINNNGVIGGYNSARTALYDTDLQTWDYLPFPGPIFSNAYQYMHGMNDYGLMVGRHDQSNPAQDKVAVIYENGIFVPVTYSTYTYGFLVDVNNNREAVGYFWSGTIADERLPVNVLINIYSDLTYTIIPLNLPAQTGEITEYKVRAINNSGDVYGSLIQDGIYKVFKFNIHTENFEIVFTQNDLSGSALDMRIRGVNNLGQVVGCYTTTGSAADRIAYIFTPAPTGTIAIDGGSDYCMTQDVALALNSADADYMQFSNDGVSYSVWESYAASKDWVLSAGEGAKSVYVKFKDQAGNVNTFIDTIILDSTAPSGTISINNGDSHTSERNVSITLSLDQEAITNVSGEITTDIVWDLAGSPYTLVGDVQINNGVRLAIEDGVVVNNPDGYQILVYGTIQAEAVPNNPVVFNNVMVNVATAGTVIFDYAEFNQGHIRNDLGFEHFTITNCRFNETSYLRINARTDSYFDRNTLTDAGYVELIANTSSHDRDIYARWNTFYGKHPTLALKSCYKVSYEGSDRLVIHSNNFLDENNYGISLHFNTSTVYATNNYWGSTDPAVIADRINDSNDDPSIPGTVLFEPFADVLYPIPPSSSNAVYMSFSNDGVTFSDWEPYSDSKAWTLSDGDGTKEVFARFKDEAGNISTVSDSIILDTTAPTGTFAIDGGSDYCVIRDVSLALNSADAAYMQFSNDGVSYSAWEPYAASKDWLLSEGEGVKSVYVKLKDEAGNVSTFNDTIVLDSTAPTGNVTINDGDNYAATGEVTLTLNTDNAVYMCFSNDGITYSDWESYSDTKTWTLSEGDGTKTVYVKYKDQAGNTFVVSHSIILDSTAPNAPVLIALGVINNNQPTLDWEVIDGTDYYILEYADNPNFDFSTLVDAIGPSEYGLETPLNDGTWYWRVMAVDFAGNESEWSAVGVFTIDTTEHCIGGPETPILLSPANGAANVSLTPVLSIQEIIDTALCNYPLKFRWRISKDPDFQGLVAQVNSESKDLTSYQLSELILDPSTTYYWKVRIIGSQGNNSEWSNVFSFTTQPPAGDDVDDNGIPDDQEVDDGDDLDGDGTPDKEQDVEIKSFKAKDGNMKLGMRSSNSEIKCIKALSTDSVDDYGNKPDQVLYGLWSYRVEVEQYGAKATIKIFLSEPAPKNSKVVFYDSLDGWEDFSEHASFNDTRTEIEIELKDGAYGDNDHTENKVIVDPGGIGLFSGSSSDVSGCFINTLFQW
jgi:hypothetical protein